MHKFNFSWRRACAAFLLYAATAITIPAQTFTTLQSFDGADGLFPCAGVAQGSGGNLYGTTGYGGANGSSLSFGTAFKVTPSGTLTTLHSFDYTDGSYASAGMVQATDGNFYGTTLGGGASGSCGSYGCGTVFKVTPGGTLTTLHSFDSTDGANPYSTLVQGSDGNFYGTTEYGGASGSCGSYGCGTVFKVTPRGTLTTLHSFDSTDGSYPPRGDGASYGWGLLRDNGFRRSQRLRHDLQDYSKRHINDGA